MAARGRRLAAAAIDTVLLVAAWAAAEWMLLLAGIEYGAAEEDRGFWDAIWAFEPGYDAFGFLIFLLVQGPLLATRAQTVGKMLLQVRIADLEGRRAPFAHIVLMRELPGWIANVTMGTGLIYFFVDVLLIFRRDRRCLHDLIAGTQVVVVR